jgi:hypothetical protein
MKQENYNIDIEHQHLPFVLVRFINKSDGDIKRARFDIDKQIFIDSIPCPPDIDLRNNIVSMYRKSISSNEGLWIVSVCKLHEGWQTPIIFRDSDKEAMDKLILNEQLQHHTISTMWVSGMAIEPLRQFLSSESK